MCGECHAPAILPPVKSPDDNCVRVGCVGIGPVGRVKEISPQLGFEPRTLYQVPSCYTEYSTTANDIQGS